MEDSIKTYDDETPNNISLESPMLPPPTFNPTPASRNILANLLQHDKNLKVIFHDGKMFRNTNRKFRYFLLARILENPASNDIVYTDFPFYSRKQLDLIHAFNTKYTHLINPDPLTPDKTIGKLNLLCRYSLRTFLIPFIKNIIAQKTEELRRLRETHQQLVTAHQNDAPPIVAKPVDGKN